MQRIAAARSLAIGRDVLTLPQLAARLAGGFISVAGSEHLHPAIREALLHGGFTELETVRDLPGTARAIARTLDRIWRADLNLAQHAHASPRLADLLLIEQRIRGRMPYGVLLPPDLRDAALRRTGHAATLFGSICIDGLIDVEPLWRPLLVSLANVTDVAWIPPTDGVDRTWFPGRTTLRIFSPSMVPRAFGCADPRSEVVEALRWARARLSEGTTPAADIAITATSPETWDEHFLVLARDAKLPLHFSHGIPSLATTEGQACAALADILINGLNQRRVRRLIRRIPATEFRRRMPDDWATGLPRHAGLFTVQQWERVLARTRPATENAVAQVLLPVLEEIAQGPTAAPALGGKLLTGQSLLLWEQALRLAPPEAIHMALNDLRVPDSSDPGNSVVWGPAAHLAANTRPLVRMLGLTSGSWPRTEGEDPIIPEHILLRRQFEPVSVTERDRRDFAAIKSHATSGLFLSRSRRSSLGSLQSPSTLWPSANEETLAKTRIPDHAFSEADRILARPKEAGGSPHVIASRQCWRAWHDNALTAHDGAHRSETRAIEDALTRVQSTTSMRRLLRDPISFVWRYALGWRSPQFEQQPLTLSPPEFGELVHELIRRALDTLAPNYSKASENQISDAIQAASDLVFASWPLDRAVPPQLLWRHIVDEASRGALRALTLDEPLQGDTRSWTELAFGDPGAAPTTYGPWDRSRPVLLQDDRLTLGGRIDRLDLSPTGDKVRITDYKTGKFPEKPDRLVLAGGKELQRVFYAMAGRQLLPETRFLVSRLVYISDVAAPLQLSGEALDETVAQVGRFVSAARSTIRTGSAVPGPDAQERFYDMRLALPADLDTYLQRKRQVFAQANRYLSDLWSRP